VRRPRLPARHRPPATGRCRCSNERFVAAHAALRSILGAALDRDPRALRFARRCGRYGATNHGKPHLEVEPGLDFSLSRSGDVALLALARGRRVGVDVERPPPGADLAAVAAQALAPGERTAIAALPPGERDAAILRAWTRKEALLKAQGLGVDGDLQKLDVASADPGPVTLAGWHVASLDGGTAAVAGEGTWHLRRRTLG
jgi:4'-phosphopantetheinyl transferase